MALGYLFFVLTFPVFAYSNFLWMAGFRRPVASRKQPRPWMPVLLSALLVPCIVLALVPAGDGDSRTLFAIDAMWAALGLAFFALTRKARPH